MIRKRLLPRWLVVAFGLALVAIMIGGARVYQSQERHLCKQAEFNLINVAHFKADQIVDWRRERLADAYVLTENPFFSEQVARLMVSNHPQTIRDMYSRLRSLKKHYGYSDVLLVNTDGLVCLRTGNSKAPLGRYIAQSLAESLRERRPVITDIQAGNDKLPPQISVIAPIFAKSGKTDDPLGAVVLLIDAQQFLYSIIDDGATSSSTVETLLVRRDGDSVMFLNELRYKKGSAFKLRIPLSRTDVPAVMAARGHVGVVRGCDYRGVDVLSATRPIPESPWFLVSKMDTNEVLAAWRFRSITIMALTFLLILAVVATANLILQRNDVAHYKGLAQAQAELSESEERLSTTLNSIGDAVISTDTNARVTSMNPVAEELTGWTLSEAITHPISEVLNIVNALTGELAPIPVDEVLSSGEVCHLANHTTLIARDGTQRQIADSAAPIRDDTGAITGVVMVFSDMTEQYRMQETLQNEKNNLAAIFASSPVGLLLLDENTMIVDANSVIASMVSRNPGEVINQRGGGGLGCVHSFENEKGCGFSSVCPDCSLRQGVTQVLTGGNSIHGVEIQTTLLIDGQERRPWLRVSAKPVTINGRKHVIVAIDDITDRKAAEEELVQAHAEIEEVNHQLVDALLQANQLANEAEQARDQIEEKSVELGHQATHDVLTGLPNRQFYTDILIETVSDRRATLKQCAVLFLDLDHFKMVNDTMGHKAGDTLLVEIAGRLSSCLREGDTLARMGGDEFTVLLKNISSKDDAEMIAKRMIEKVALPVEIGGNKLVVGASIGISIYPDNASDAVGLLKFADAAMYKAKEYGRNNYQFYSDEISQENQSRIDMERDLRLAIERDELKVYYQPIADVKTMEIAGAEALLRWDHPEKGSISPGVFIPIAEETGLIVQIGKMVLEIACKQCKSWQDMGYTDLEISVNVSPIQLADIGFVSEVFEACSQAGLPTRCLKLEVTETLLAKSDAAVDILTVLKSLGVSIFLDDFGIGYSSLSRLNNLPIDHLKIDGSFIRDIDSNKNDRAMVESITVMAHNLGIKVTAEWVEEQEQLAIIRSLGCDYAQGYLVSPALSAEAFEDFIRDWTLAQRQADAA